MNEPKTIVSRNDLQDVIERVFTACRVPTEDARQAAEVLITSDLRGIDSHGVARLRAYVEMLNASLINPDPNIRIERERASTATIDGDNGLGLVVGPKANNIAMEKAEKVGSGWVAVNNTNHFGIAGYYPLQALERNQIGWAMTNTGKWMAPVWGAERMLGTNPIAIAFPGLEEPPVVIDLATSAVSFGKVQIKMREGKPLPDGWILDKNGLPSNDPQELISGGTLLPLGSAYETGGYKGYALASMVDILTAVLSGANWGPFAPPFASRVFIPEKSVGKGIGHFFGAMDIDGFMEVDEFKKRIDEWVQTFRKTKAAIGTEGPIIPGDPERHAWDDRILHGIPLLEAVVDDLHWVAEQTGVDKLA
ncbi:MAG: Ldh family oxidoreductase [Bacteroidia bacterium]